MTTLSKEDAIRAVLDGKVVETSAPGMHSWMRTLSEKKLEALRYIITSAPEIEFRIKPEPKVRYISKHHLDAGWSDSTFLREVYPPTDILRVEAYPDGSYRVTRVEE